MPLWMNRAGRHGEFEPRFLEEGRIYLTWTDLNRDLAVPKSKMELKELLGEVYPDASKARLANNAGQVWAFSHRMQPGDWIVLPSKLKPSIHIAEITGQYVYNESGGERFYHYRTVEWLQKDIPRTAFGQDLLYSFGAFLTVCQIKRNDAEQRVRAMKNAGWKSASIPGMAPGDEEEGEAASSTDLEQVARDQIAMLIIARFKGHGMARLVNAILKAQGYTTHMSPEGPDKGIDILAAPGPMGFGNPRLCVQVKSGDSPLDRPTLDQLIGSMQNVQAQQGLFVSWGGFKSSVDKERATQFFRVRLWDRDDLIEELLRNYDKLEDEIRTELPLKRIWTTSAPDEDA